MQHISVLELFQKAIRIESMTIRQENSEYYYNLNCFRKIMLHNPGKTLIELRFNMTSSRRKSIT